MQDDSLLGRQIEIPKRYSAQILRGIAREEGRAALGIPLAPLPFCGEDLWRAYEVSWLGSSGQPRAAIASLRIPCASPRIVESKSLKLYLASLHQERFASAEDVVRLVASDLSVLTQSRVTVSLARELDRLPPGAEAPPAGESLDGLELAIDRYQLAPELLLAAARAAGAAHTIRERLYTHAFRSLCPVTGQPDFATIEIRYTGRPIERTSLLRYLVSYREHSAFHESCVEQIYWDLWRAWAPDELSVEGRFTRRGGIDINPVRSSREQRAIDVRTARQ